MAPRLEGCGRRLRRSTTSSGIALARSRALVRSVVGVVCHGAVEGCVAVSAVGPVGAHTDAVGCSVTNRLGLACRTALSPSCLSRRTVFTAGRVIATVGEALGLEVIAVVGAVVAGVASSSLACASRHRRTSYPRLERGVLRSCVMGSAIGVVVVASRVAGHGAIADGGRHPGYRVAVVRCLRTFTFGLALGPGAHRHAIRRLFVGLTSGGRNGCRGRVLPTTRYGQAGVAFCHATARCMRSCSAWPV